MTTNEPTTGEITFGEVWEFLSEHREHKVLRSRITLGDILNDMLNCHQKVIDAKTEIAILTARAEQAEADIKKFAHTSHTCGHNESGLCKLAADDHGFCEKCPAWEWRGLPQEGEGEMKYKWIVKTLTSKGWVDVASYSRKKDAKEDACWHNDNGVPAKVERVEQDGGAE